MNTIAFGTKRAFHGFLRVTRKLLGSYGLTAARFDLMFALLEDPRSDVQPSPMRQSDLRKKLGVTASVVSRMVKALVSLGLLERRKCLWMRDRRQRWISFTDRGLALMRVARRVVLRSVERLVWIAVCFGGPDDLRRRWRQMAALESFLTLLRYQFGDKATLEFLWGPLDH